MTFALITLFIIFFFIPGFIFRRAYFCGEFSKQFNTTNNTYFMCYNFIASLFVFFLFICLYVKINKIDLNIEFKTYIDFVFNKKVEQDILSHFKTTYKFNLFIKFFLHVSIGAFFLAKISLLTVTYLNLDIHFKILRFKNKWYYIRNNLEKHFNFSGFYKIRKVSGDMFAIIKLKKLQEEKKGESQYFYGKLSNYYVDPNGDLTYMELLKKDESRIEIRYNEIRDIEIASYENTKKGFSFLDYFCGNSPVNRLINDNSTTNYISLFLFIFTLIAYVYISFKYC